MPDSGSPLSTTVDDASDVDGSVVLATTSVYGLYVSTRDEMWTPSECSTTESEAEEYDAEDEDDSDLEAEDGGADGAIKSEPSDSSSAPRPVFFGQPAGVMVEEESEDGDGSESTGSGCFEWSESARARRDGSTAS